MMNKFGRYLIFCLTFGYYGSPPVGDTEPTQPKAVRRQRGGLSGAPLIVHRGQEAYYFNRWGDFDYCEDPFSEESTVDRYEQGDSDVVFKCAAINESNARRKFRKWASDNLSNIQWDDYVRVQQLTGRDAYRRPLN